MGRTETVVDQAARGHNQPVSVGTKISRKQSSLLARLGVTDPVSGQAVAKLAAPKTAKKKKAQARRKPKRAPAKKTASKR